MLINHLLNIFHTKMYFFGTSYATVKLKKICFYFHSFYVTIYENISSVEISWASMMGYTENTDKLSTQVPTTL